jgi:hypothetical protein
MDKKQREQLKEFLHYASAILESMNTSLRTDPDNVWRYASYKQYIRKYNQLVQTVSQVTRIDTIVDLYDLDRIPGNADTVATQQKELFESVHVNLSILKAWLENKLHLKADEITNLKNFLQANLRRAIFSTPEREVEVQNAVEQLLIGRGLAKGIDYDRETGRVKVSVKESVPDFIFPRLSLALEVKFSKDKEKSKAIVDEINADIMAYSRKYSHLLFVVYDLGIIRDEVEFKQDLEMADGVDVIVVKH